MGRTCNKCGRVHYPTTLKEAIKHNDDLERITGCVICGNPWQNFREAKEEDCPVGSTMSAILYEEFSKDVKET